MKTPWQHCSNSEHGHLRAAFIYHKLQRYSLIFTKHQMFRDWKCCPHLPERRIPDRQVVCKKPKIEERGAKSLRTTCCPICSLSNSISFSFSIPVNTVWLKNLQYYKAWGRKHLTRLLNLEGKGNRKVMFALSAFLLLKFTTAPFQADLISPKLDFDFPAFPFRDWALVYTYHMCWVTERLPLCPNRNISCDIVRVPNLYFGIQYSWGTWLAVTWLFCTYFLIAAKAASTMGNCDRQSCKVFASAATAATGEVICIYLYSRILHLEMHTYLFFFCENSQTGYIYANMPYNWES